MDLKNTRLKLIENKEGLASDETIMVFDDSDSPYKATYSGPNIKYGHAIVSNIDGKLTMLYHAIAKTGELSAGKATVYLSKGRADAIEMQLDWQWLTGDLSAGISKWREVEI